MAVKPTEPFLVDTNIGENSNLFGLTIKPGASQIIDLDKLAYINSIGVKNWINWTHRWAKDASVSFINAPLVIVNQASSVSGFLPINSKIESFKAPYACEKCGEETLVKLERGKHFDYAKPGEKPMLSLPENVLCRKCRSATEPDLIPDKHLKFLQAPSN